MQNKLLFQLKQEQQAYKLFNTKIRNQDIYNKTPVHINEMGA